MLHTDANFTPISFWTICATTNKNHTNLHYRFLCKKTYPFNKVVLNLIFVDPCCMQRKCQHLRHNIWLLPIFLFASNILTSLLCQGKISALRISWLRDESSHHLSFGLNANLTVYPPTSDYSLITPTPWYTALWNPPPQHHSLTGWIFPPPDTDWYRYKSSQWFYHLLSSIS